MIDDSDRSVDAPDLLVKLMQAANEEGNPKQAIDISVLYHYLNMISKRAAELQDPKLNTYLLQIHAFKLPEGYDTETEVKKQRALKKVYEDLQEKLGKKGKAN